MSIYHKRGVRAGGLEDVFNMPEEPVQDLLCTYADTDDRIEARSNTFTIVMNRDIRKTVEIANQMAVHLSKKYPDKKILLVNTYAGSDLMQSSIAIALAKTGSKLPPQFKKHLPDNWKDAIEEGAHSYFPTNLRVLDCESGTLEAWRIEEEIKIFGGEIVILNSFEFSAFDDRDRKQLAHSLVSMREQHSLTMVIFSHEMRTDVSIYTPAHGGIGIISAFAGSVWHVMSRPDRARFNSYYRKLARMGNDISVYKPKLSGVHEPQTDTHALST